MTDDSPRAGAAFDNPASRKLPEPIEAAIAVLVEVATSTDGLLLQDQRNIDAAVEQLRDAVRDQPSALVGRPMSTAPRDGFAFLVSGVHDRDDPPSAERGVKAGMPWWGIALFDIWREPHRFVFAKDGAPLWSDPVLWCALPTLVGSKAPPPPLPDTGVRALIGAFHALRSYECGNSACDLAQDMAEHCAEVLRGLGVRTFGMDAS